MKKIIALFLVMCFGFTTFSYADTCSEYVSCSNGVLALTSAGQQLFTISSAKCSSVSFNSAVIQSGKLQCNFSPSGTTFSKRTVTPQANTGWSSTSCQNSYCSCPGGSSCEFQPNFN